MYSKQGISICLALLTDFTNSQQILTKNEASTILKSRTKRDNNNIFEELGKDNLERECIEQSCSSEEMMEIWKNAPGRQEIVGGRKKYHALRTELKRIRKVQNSKKNPETRTVQIQNNLEGDCRNDDECATYFQVLNDPCSVEVDTFLLDPEFSISGWNTSEAVNVNEVCWGPGTLICKNKYSERVCECKPDFNAENYCKSELQLGFVGELCPREILDDLCDNDILMIGFLVGSLVSMVVICVLCMWNCGFFDCCCRNEDQRDEFDAPEDMFRSDDRGYSKGVDV